MNEAASNLLSRISRRVVNMFANGKVQFVNDGDRVQEFQAALSAQEIQDHIPRIAEFGLTSHPPTGSDAVIVFLKGDRSQGVAVATSHGPSRPVGLSAGETVLYSLVGQRVSLLADGIVIDAKGLPVTINNATDVTINSTTTVKIIAPVGIELDTPLLKVTGDIQDQSAAAGPTMAQMRAIYDIHTHPGVQTGAGSTGTPSSPM